MRYLLLILLLAGCAETRTQDEIEWRRAMDRENWTLCAKVYEQAGVPTYHRGHVHRRNAVDKIEWVRADLMHNNCRRVLGPYWAD